MEALPLARLAALQGDSGAEQLLTVIEVARELRCSKAHVHNLINGVVHGTEPLPAIKLGRRRLVRRSSLIAWLLSCEHRRNSTPRTHERNSNHA